MFRFNILLVLVAIGSASGCKYYCRAPGTFDYECCDNGNPYFESADNNEEATVTEVKDGFALPPSNCYYYCAYNGEIYCCGDVSQPIPESHEPNEGRCPEEEEQFCKKNGIFLNKSARPKASGALRLASPAEKEYSTCASDGYCQKDEKCCPSKCAKKHICLKSLSEDDNEE